MKLETLFSWTLLPGLSSWLATFTLRSDRRLHMRHQDSVSVKPKDRQYSILLADTVLVRDQGPRRFSHPCWTNVLFTARSDPAVLLMFRSFVFPFCPFWLGSRARTKGLVRFQPQPLTVFCVWCRICTLIGSRMLLRCSERRFKPKL